MQAELRVAVITGGAGEGRFGDLIAQWLLEEVRRSQLFRTDHVDLRELELPWVRPSDPAVPPEATAALLARLRQADAFLVLTPEYNHGYPAPLKYAIDLGYAEWHAKPVAFVSYGGMSGGLRAVEQLRQVFVELHAVTVRDGVSFHRVEEQFDADGAVRDVEAVGAAAQAMLAQLEWWADALRRARQLRPYRASRSLHQRKPDAPQPDRKRQPDTV
ncbi:MAG TPA: NAD(P)H-dependent oxidoreductase [Devosiaceae bacterium]|jgi:NAD(P)H-dependent FMN reductase|nr:NAD(P)H-dependent oxidoreductase [Devosiaceae bacterium]